MVTTMERYIAIDNVCAWPNLTQMPDGSVIATIFNQPTHGGWEGDVECWAGEDEGRLWRLRGVPAPHEPGTNRMNVAAGLARDGSLVVLASGWSTRGTVGNYSSPLEGEVLDSWVCRSTDGGAGWERSGAIAAPSGGPRHIVPFGDTVQLADGMLGACVYGAVASGDHTAYFYVSADDGRSWTVRGVIREGNTNETTPVVLPDGCVLVVARTLGDQHLEVLISEDHGTTWRGLGPATLGLQHPGHLLRLANGHVLLTYGIRNKGLYGVGARVSSDGGRTWDPPRVLVHLEGSTDGGYPSSVEMGDGTVVTAYYSSGIPSHQRYHMGVVRWHLEV